MATWTKADLISPADLAALDATPIYGTDWSNNTRVVGVSCSRMWAPDGLGG